MNLPSRRQCFDLFAQYHLPSTVIDHSLTVNKVANFLALKLKQTGINIDLDLVDRASLLHDLLRLCDFPLDRLPQLKEYPEKKEIWKKQIAEYKDCHHNQAAFEVLKDKYPEMAQVIIEHGFEYLWDNSFSSLESKIVHYADKRVDFDKIVTLDQRLEEGIKRWKTPKEELEKTFAKLKNIEKEIFDLIGEDSSIIK